MVCVSPESNRGVFTPVNCAKRLILRAINQSIVLQYNGISGKYKHFSAEKA